MIEYIYLLTYLYIGRIVKSLLEEASVQSGKPVQDQHTYNDRTRGGSQMPRIRFNHSTYHAMHVRHRNDFSEQFQEDDFFKLTPERILNFATRHMNPNISTLLYIATDVNNITFFEPLGQIFQLRFLSDYMTQFRDGREDSAINYNQLGMVEQMICANADTFIGTAGSTYSDHIMRLRGYYGDGRDERSFKFYNDIDFTHLYEPWQYLWNSPEAYTNIDAKYLTDISTHSTRAPADKRGDDDDGIELNPDEEDDDYDSRLSFMPSRDKRVKDYNDDTVT